MSSYEREGTDWRPLIALVLLIVIALLFMLFFQGLQGPSGPTCDASVGAYPCTVSACGCCVHNPHTGEDMEYCPAECGVGYTFVSESGKCCSVVNPEECIRSDQVCINPGTCSAENPCCDDYACTGGKCQPCKENALCSEETPCCSGFICNQNGRCESVSQCVGRECPTVGQPCRVCDLNGDCANCIDNSVCTYDSRQQKNVCAPSCGVDAYSSCPQCPTGCCSADGQCASCGGQACSAAQVNTNCQLCDSNGKCTVCTDTLCANNQGTYTCMEKGSCSVGVPCESIGVTGCDSGCCDAATATCISCLDASCTRELWESGKPCVYVDEKGNKMTCGNTLCAPTSSELKDFKCSSACNECPPGYVCDTTCDGQPCRSVESGECASDKNIIADVVVDCTVDPAKCPLGEDLCNESSQFCDICKKNPALCKRCLLNPKACQNDCETYPVLCTFDVCTVAPFLCDNDTIRIICIPVTQPSGESGETASSDAVSGQCISREDVESGNLNGNGVVACKKFVNIGSSGKKDDGSQDSGWIYLSLSDFKAWLQNINLPPWIFSECAPEICLDCLPKCSEKAEVYDLNNDRILDNRDLFAFDKYVSDGILDNRDLSAFDKYASDGILDNRDLSAFDKYASDGILDNGDLFAFDKYASSAAGVYNTKFDFNGDGKVDANDRKCLEEVCSGGGCRVMKTRVCTNTMVMDDLEKSFIANSITAAGYKMYYCDGSTHKVSARVDVNKYAQTIAEGADVDASKLIAYTGHFFDDYSYYAIYGDPYISSLSSGEGGSTQEGGLQQSGGSITPSAEMYYSACIYLLPTPFKSMRQPMFYVERQGCTGKVVLYPDSNYEKFVDGEAVSIFEKCMNDEDLCTEYHSGVSQQCKSSAETKCRTELIDDTNPDSCFSKCCTTENGCRKADGTKDPTKAAVCAQQCEASKDCTNPAQNPYLAGCDRISNVVIEACKAYEMNYPSFKDLGITTYTTTSPCNPEMLDKFHSLGGPAYMDYTVESACSNQETFCLAAASVFYSIMVGEVPHVVVKGMSFLDTPTVEYGNSRNDACGPLETAFMKFGENEMKNFCLPDIKTICLTHTADQSLCDFVETCMPKYVRLSCKQMAKTCATEHCSEAPGMECTMEGCNPSSYTMGTSCYTSTYRVVSATCADVKSG